MRTKNLRNGNKTRVEGYLPIHHPADYRTEIYRYPTDVLRIVGRIWWHVRTFREINPKYRQ